jgi:branched-chain amino acid transport system permease protein
LDSILGALVGGLAIAFIQTLTATYWSGSLQDVAAYVVLMLVLLARPSGLFGRPDAARL